METLLKDLKHSLRMFWHSKTFTITAVAALALGIGANTAVFSIVNTVLGAEPGRLKNAVFVQGLKLSLAGVALGVSFAFALTRFVASDLYEVKPWDPTVFADVPVLLSVVAILTIWIPARRASRINPMDALRYG
jgi:hypothetical protein